MCESHHVKSSHFNPLGVFLEDILFQRLIYWSDCGHFSGSVIDGWDCKLSDV